MTTRSGKTCSDDSPTRREAALPRSHESRSLIAQPPAVDEELSVPPPTTVNIQDDEVEPISFSPSTFVPVGLVTRALSAEKRLPLDPMEIEHLRHLRARTALREPSATKVAPSTTTALSFLEDSLTRDLRKFEKPSSRNSRQIMVPASH